MSVGFRRKIAVPLAGERQEINEGPNTRESVIGTIEMD